MIRLVKQDTPHSCGLACMAMVLGFDMDTMRDHAGRTCEEVFPLPEDGPPYIGFSADEMLNVLFEHGIPAVRFIARHYYPAQHWMHIGWDRLANVKENQVLTHLQRGGTAIVGVKSLNMPGCHHWIVMSQHEIYDPSPKKTYDASMAPIEFDEAILIGRVFAQDIISVPRVPTAAEAA